MAVISAGLLMYRVKAGKLQVLLVHPGGPFYQKKDLGVWSIPKGEAGSDEDLLQAAKREFAEETGFTPTGQFMPLKPVNQRAGKIVHAWAFQGDCDPDAIVSNTFTIEWPPHSGRQKRFPEIDRAEFFTIADGKLKINPGQIPLLEGLEEIWQNRI